MKRVQWIIISIMILFSGNILHSATISGRITFKNGQPIANLKIICETVYFTHVTRTDNGGNYKLIVSDREETVYYLFIVLPKGKREKIGQIVGMGLNHTVDVKLTINSFEETD